MKRASAFLPLFLAVTMPVWAVSPAGSAGSCESENGRFIDKNNDGSSNMSDWLEMSDTEKKDQVVWNLETLCKEPLPDLVQGAIDAMNRLSVIEKETPNKV